MSLFRNEVIEARDVRAIGSILPLYRQPTLLLTCLLVGLTLAALVWLFTGSFARTERVAGWIVPNGAMAPIVPQRAGVLAEVLVSEGQRVKKGASLARIVVAQASSNFADPVSASRTVMKDKRALIDMQSGLNTQSSINEKKRLKAAAGSLRRRIDSTRSQIALQKERLRAGRDNAQALKTALEKKYISRIEYQTRQAEIIQSRQQLDQLFAEQESLEGQLAETQLQLAQAETNAEQREAGLRLERASLDEQEITASQAADIILTAPADGLVTGVQYSIGQTVAAGAAVMAIIVEGAKLEAELFAPSRAIGFASPGQEVRLLYDAYPFEQFGSYRGLIASISNTVYRPSEVNSPLRLEEPVYRVKVLVEEQEVRAFGKAFSVRPGMTLSANVVLERQSFMSWLMRPLNALRNRS